MNQFKKQVLQRSNLYNEYINILNGLLELTPKQSLVLAKLFELNDTTPSTKSLLNKENRRDIEEICNIDECNLSTYLTLFKSKNLLIQENKIWKINSAIKPNIYNNGIEITFLITVKE